MYSSRRKIPNPTSSAAKRISPASKRRIPDPPIPVISEYEELSIFAKLVTFCWKERKERIERIERKERI